MEAAEEKIRRKQAEVERERAEAARRAIAAAEKQERDAEARARTLLHLGRVLDRSGNPDGARSHYRDVVKARPGGPAAKEAEAEIREIESRRPGEFKGLMPYAVERVLDGSTVELTIEGRPTSVHLLGVAAPAAADGDVAGRRAGIEAAEALRGILSHKSAWVRYGATHADSRGEPAAYLYRSPDGLDVNRELIRLGLARSDGKTPHDRRDEFQEAESGARDAGRGLWGAGPGKTSPPEGSGETRASGNSEAVRKTIENRKSRAQNRQRAMQKALRRRG